MTLTPYSLVSKIKMGVIKFSKITLWVMYCLVFYEMTVNGIYPFYCLAPIFLISVSIGRFSYPLLYYNAIYSVIFYFFHNLYFSYLLFIYFSGFMSLFLFFDLNKCRIPDDSIRADD
jgi:hypothetical protein